MSKQVHRNPRDQLPATRTSGKQSKAIVAGASLALKKNANVNRNSSCRNQDWVNTSAAAKNDTSQSSRANITYEPAVACTAGLQVRVFDEVQCTRDCQDIRSNTDSPENISTAEIEEIRSLKHPPYVVQRALEATCLLLLASEAPKDPKPPDWPAVQAMLADVRFLTRILTYDVQELHRASDLLAYVGREYFGTNDCPPAASSLREALSFERVYRASRAAGALFRWCSSTVATAQRNAETCLKMEPAREEENSAAESIDLEPPLNHSDPYSIANAVNVEAPSVALPARLRPDRCFETIVPSLSYSMSTSITMEVIEEVVRARPSLRLELSACADPYEGPQKASERLRNVKNYLFSKGIDCGVRPGMDKASAKREPGITCTVLLDDDEELVRYLRKARNTSKGGETLTTAEEECEAIVTRLEEWFETRMRF